MKLVEQSANVSHTSTKTLFSQTKFNAGNALHIYVGAALSIESEIVNNILA